MEVHCKKKSFEAKKEELRATHFLGLSRKIFTRKLEREREMEGNEKRTLTTQF